ncbi:hypothetical protein VPH35_027767 [Triticum aestivum]
MEPRRREPGEFPPEYVTNGEASQFFSVEFEHNGIFLGECIGGELKFSYIGCSREAFDYCHSDTWSLGMIKYCLSRMDYDPTDPQIKVYWILPDKYYGDGLLCVDNPDVIAAMVRSSREAKTLDLLVDEENKIQTLYPEIILKGCPTADGNEDEEQGEDADHDAENAEEGEDAVADHDAENAMEGEDAESDHDADADNADNAVENNDGEGELNETDSDFYESDYDCEDGDDDLFAQNVDKSLNDNNEEEEEIFEEEDPLDDDELNLSKDELEKLKYTFRTFNAEMDMSNPIFRVGQVFGEMKELREAVTAYTVKNRVKIIKARNEAERFNGVCQPDCPWRLKASRDNRTESIVIREYNGEHTCQKTWDSKCLTVKYLTEIFMDEFRDNKSMDLGTFGRKVQQKFKLNPVRMKLGRARSAALKIIHGDEKAQYSLLSYPSEQTLLAGSVSGNNGHFCHCH